MDKDAGTGKCRAWSGVNTCVQSKLHCENGTVRTYNENTVFACQQSGIALADVAAPSLTNNRVHGNQVEEGGRAGGAASGHTQHTHTE